jgi:Alpha galactosidase A
MHSMRNIVERHLCSVSEKLFMRVADVMAAEGYREAGYEYVNIDDCWLSTERDDKHRIQPDPKRFPSGIRHLADYVRQS